MAGGVIGLPCSWRIYVNTGTWPYRLEESRICISKIWSWVPWDSDPGMTTLARTSRNCKRQTHYLVREGAPNQEIRNCLAVIKIWSWAPDECLTPRQPGRLNVGRNITLTLNELVVGQSPASKNVSSEAENTVGIRHQVTTGADTADWEDLVHAVVNWRVCELTIVL
jgi:hypothetical protein